MAQEGRPETIPQLYPAAPPSPSPALTVNVMDVEKLPATDVLHAQDLGQGWGTAEGPWKGQAGGATLLGPEYTPKPISKPQHQAALAQAPCHPVPPPASPALPIAEPRQATPLPCICAPPAPEFPRSLLLPRVRLTPSRPSPSGRLAPPPDVTHATHLRCPGSAAAPAGGSLRLSPPGETARRQGRLLGVLGLYPPPLAPSAPPRAPDSPPPPSSLPPLPLPAPLGDVTSGTERVLGPGFPVPLQSRTFERPHCPAGSGRTARLAGRRIGCFKSRAGSWVESPQHAQRLEES